MNEIWTQVLTIVGSVLTIVISNLGIILWFRKESREDWVRSQNTIDAIQKEMMDFHKQLLHIERRRK